MINKINQQEEVIYFSITSLTPPLTTFQPMMSDQSDQSDPQYDDEYSGVPQDYQKPCTEEDCDDWITKIQDFRPSYQGGGGGGGGATIIFKLSDTDPTKLVPLIVAGGGGGMADLPSDNDPDSSRLYDLQAEVSEVEAAAPVLDPLIR